MFMCYSYATIDKRGMLRLLKYIAVKLITYIYVLTIINKAGQMQVRLSLIGLMYAMCVHYK